MIHNGVELQGMTHNGIEVQTWTHNGVEIYSASKPWIAINSNSALTSPCVKPTVITGNTQVYWQGSDLGYEANGSGGITTKNVDGTNYLPTQGCKFAKFRISTFKAEAAYFDLTGKKSDGTTVVIGSYQTIGGTEKDYYIFKDITANVSGYKSVKLATRNSNVSYAGLAYLEFHN